MFKAATTITNNNNSKLKVKDIAEAKATVEDIEQRFLEQQKLLKQQHLSFNCEKCGADIRVHEGKKRPTCPNEKCLARYYVKFVYPPTLPLSRADNTFTTTSIAPVTQELSDDVIIPTIHATFKGYSYESRVNYPAAKCTNEQLWARIDTASEKLQFVVDGSKEGLLLDLLEIIQRSLKE